MLKTLRVKWAQGQQFIPDVRSAKPNGFHGQVRVEKTHCQEACQSCVPACPTKAISLAPLTLDLGKCIFCSECVRVCPAQKLTQTPEYKMSASARTDLHMTEETFSPHIQAQQKITALFGRSLRLRSVSSGGCNACELEISAMANVNFDVSRFGIEFVASPRHADGLVLSGPMTKNMKSALEHTYEAMPAPKFIVAVGACAISGGLFADSPEIDRSFLERFKPDLFVPGCPPHPLTLVNGILDFLGHK